MSNGFLYSTMQIDYYRSQANELSPSRKEEELGVLYYNYSPDTSKNMADKFVFETSFVPHKGMKIYLS